MNPVPGALDQQGYGERPGIIDPYFAIKQVMRFVGIVDDECGKRYP